jgi:hypothetical protein
MNHEACPRPVSASKAFKVKMLASSFLLSEQRKSNIGRRSRLSQTTNRTQRLATEANALFSRERPTQAILLPEVNQSEKKRRWLWLPSKSDQYSKQRLLRLPPVKVPESTYGSIKTHEEHYGFAFTLAQMHQGKPKSAQREEPLQ